MIVEKVYKDRSNTVELQLWDDSISRGTLAKTNLTTATKVEIILESGATYNSVDDPSEVTYTNDGVVIFALGGKNITTTNATIVVYFPDYADGFVWETEFILRSLNASGH